LLELNTRDIQVSTPPVSLCRYIVQVTAATDKHAPLIGLFLERERA